jgi:hypothetical protein
MRSSTIRQVLSGCVVLRGGRVGGLDIDMSASLFHYFIEKASVVNIKVCVVLRCVEDRNGHDSIQIFRDGAGPGRLERLEREIRVVRRMAESRVERL